MVRSRLPARSSARRFRGLAQRRSQHSYICRSSSDNASVPGIMGRGFHCLMCMITSSRLGTPLATGGSSDIFAWGERQVIKRFRRGTPVTAAAREAACTRAARAAGAPAPETFGVIELDGDNGVVFERIEGPSMLEPLLAGRH